MKPAIFKDKSIQQRFDTDGYVVIDFMSPEEARQIADKFYALHPNLPNGFYTDAFNPNEFIKQDIFEHTEKIINRAVNQKFEHFKKLGSSFLCKSPGPEGKVEVHQDWTITDEKKYYSATIWIPAADTTEANGTLRVLPGSHLFSNAYRSNNINVFYQHQMELLWDNMLTVPLKAGQAFVLNHAVIHASAPNTTAKERLAIAYAVCPEEADLLFYFGKQDGRVEKFAMPDDFLQKYYNVGQRPLFGRVVDEFPYTVPLMSAEELFSLIKHENDKRGIKSVFSSLAKQQAIRQNTPVDNRNFIQKYSPLNIAREVKKRLFAIG